MAKNHHARLFRDSFAGDVRLNEDAYEGLRTKRLLEPKVRKCFNRQIISHYHR